MRAETEQRRIAEAVAAAGIAVVALPATNLYLQGREHQQAMPRGVTAVRALLAAGVTVAAGADNLQDPFNPMGRACPFETAALMVLTAHLQTDDAWAAVSDAGGASDRARCAPGSNRARPPTCSRCGPGRYARRSRSVRPTASSGEPASASNVCRSTLAPAVMSSGSVYSAMLCDSPLTLGVKIIAVGHTRASIWASWPAPLGRRRVEYPRRCAVRLDEVDGRRIEVDRLEAGQRAGGDRDRLGGGEPFDLARRARPRPRCSTALVGVAQVDGDRGRWPARR